MWITLEPATDNRVPPEVLLRKQGENFTVSRAGTSPSRHVVAPVHRADGGNAAPRNGGWWLPHFHQYFTPRWCEQVPLEWRE
ncbi:hypothetical protein HEK616_76120 (plasmid) [Streptomyces nigrescens]|uniref:Uncharacterized protein n=1 Tax=Streptomyces nigrescens TaxID=1920 RepID=A0ABM8A6A0_STRNI|nr:hypothetical protein HEK616_76120 [Streptomyces nigrescens]